MPKKNKLVIIIISILFMYSCGEAAGNHSLGNNFSLLEGDKLQDQVIVYCYGGNDGDCKGGSYIIPTYAHHYDAKGNYTEYVEAAKANKDWIVAKSLQIQNKKENYWIVNKNFSLKDKNCEKLNCDSIILTQVTGPLSVSDFQDQLKKRNIDLQLE